MKRVIKDASDMSPDASDLPSLDGSPEELSAFLALQQHEFVTYRISVLSRIFDRQADRRVLRKRGLSLTDSRVLGHLFINKQATVRGLALEMHMHRPQISRAMSALVRRGYAKKKSDPEDRRSAVFTITAKGNKFYGEAMLTSHDRQKDIAEFIGLDKYKELNDTLRLLINNFGPLDQDIDTPVE
jgi:DNA-binding MarR family transcriptional regulator